MMRLYLSVILSGISQRQFVGKSAYGIISVVQKNKNEKFKKTVRAKERKPSMLEMGAQGPKPEKISMNKVDHLLQGWIMTNLKAEDGLVIYLRRMKIDEGL